MPKATPLRPPEARDGDDYAGLMSIDVPVSATGRITRYLQGVRPDPDRHFFFLMEHTGGNVDMYLVHRPYHSIKAWSIDLVAVYKNDVAPGKVGIRLCPIVKDINGGYKAVLA